MPRLPNHHHLNPPWAKKTGIAKLRGGTQAPLASMTVTSEFDAPDTSKKKEAMPSEVGNVGPAGSPPIDRACVPRRKKGYCARIPGVYG